VCISFLFFPSFFSLLSHFPPLFPVASVSFRFMVWVPPSKVRQSRTSKPKRLRSVAADMEVELDSGVIWFCGLWIFDLELWLACVWLWVCDFGLWSAWVWVVGLWFRIVIDMCLGYGFVIWNCDWRGLDCGFVIWDCDQLGWCW